MTVERRTTLTSEVVKNRLAKLKDSFVTPPLPIAPNVWPYYKAAAVLSSFNPADLRPIGEANASLRDALRSLVSDCVLEGREDKAAWQLRGDVRRLVLQQMDASEITEAISNKSPDADQRFSETIGALAAGNIGNEMLESIEDVQRAMVASDWLGVGEPTRVSLRKRLELLELMQPFNDLVGDHFRGRVEELRLLANYVGSTSRSFVTEVRRHFQHRDALAVVGPGGVGKSTLVARFILDHAAVVAKGDLAFAYLDADRPTVLPEDPRSLLMEAGRQLAVQFPDAEIDIATLRSELAEIDERADSNKRSVAVRRASVDQLGRILRRIDRRFLLVLDTFEEIQSRSSDFVGAIGVFLEELNMAWPDTRTVIATRAPIAEFSTTTIALEALDEAAAVGFLAYRGITDQNLAKGIVSQLGGNPLTLRLAADLVTADATEGVTELKGISTRNVFLLRVEERVIQGQLYRRILNHIKDETVRKLAHPGLVVRRITPTVILRVLAQPCGLNIKSIDQARDLFRRLAKEVSLVERDGDGLRHRADVRKVMLRLLVADEPEKVKTIHERAVEYYKKAKGTRSRGEEVYHRLMLEQGPTEIDKRWRNELKNYLSGVMEELPPVSRAYVATKLGYQIDDATRKQADTVIWERAAIAKAQDLLDLDRPQDALAVLRERAERSGSSEIHALEVEALRNLGRYGEAVGIVQRALPWMRGDPARLVELAEMGAIIAQSNHDVGTAIELLESAALVSRTRDGLSRLRIAVQLFRLRNVMSSSRRPAEEDQLIALYRNTSRAELNADETVILEAAALIADRLPEALANAVDLAVNGHWSNRRLTAIAQVIRRASPYDAKRAAAFARIADNIQDLRDKPTGARGRSIQKLLFRVLELDFPRGNMALELARLIREVVLEPFDDGGDDAPRRAPGQIRSRKSSSRRRLKK